MAKRLVLNARLDSSAAENLRKELVDAHGNDLILDGARVDMLGGLCVELLMSARHLWHLQKTSLSIENASVALIDNLKRMGLSLDDVATGGRRMTVEVLAVDDSRTMRDMISLALASDEFQVHLAEDGEHGLEVLDGINPDVIITDINMPKLDGFGFIDAVRKREDSRTIPILVLTTEGSADLKARARDAGATGWIVKPFAQDKLIRALRLVAG